MKFLLFVFLIASIVSAAWFGAWWAVKNPKFQVRPVFAGLLGAIVGLSFAAFMSAAIINWHQHQLAVGAGFSSAEQMLEANKQGFSTRLQQIEYEARLAAKRQTEREAKARELAEAEAKAKAKAIDEKLARERAKAEKDARCKEDFNCYAESLRLKATFACQPKIEALAVVDFKWVDGFWGSKITHYKRGPAGSIMYSGDRIKFQNRLGSWIRHIYECLYYPEQNVALQASAKPGRITGG